MTKQIPVIALAVVSALGIVGAVLVGLYGDLDAPVTVALVGQLLTLAVGGVAAIAGLVRGPSGE